MASLSVKTCIEINQGDCILECHELKESHFKPTFFPSFNWNQRGLKQNYSSIEVVK